MLRSNNLVTLANMRFQLRPIKNSNMSSHVADQAFHLQTLRGVSHSFAAHSQHVRDELLSHLQLIRLRPVVGHQQPATESLFYRVKPIAHGRLRDLSDQSLRISKQQVLKLASQAKLTSHRL